MRCLRESRCDACPDHSKKIVVGEGPIESSILFCGEAPGKMEANIGRPFIGKTGMEFDNTYLPLAGVTRSDVFVSNMVCCHWADSSDPPPDWLIKSCSSFHLKAELEALNPKYVVLMGGIPNSLIGLNVDMVHGTGRTAEIFGKEYRVFSSYHPALGLHQSSKMQNLLDDFKALRLFLKDRLPDLENEIPNPSFFLVDRPDQIDDALDGLERDVHMAIDTESRKTWKGYTSTIRYIPWSIQFSVSPYEAFIIMVNDAEIVQRFASRARKFRKIVMHNAPHDMDILRNVGCELDWDHVEDTMSMAYIDARLPKGLKALSYRLLGSTMRNFDDVVTPYGIKAAMEYFEQASMMEWIKPKGVATGEYSEKKCPDCKGAGVFGVGRGKMRQMYECPCKTGYVTMPKLSRKQGIGQKISRLMGDYMRTGSINPWERWEGWDSAVEELMAKLGPLPLASVELVPQNEFLDYAGSDAVSTWRVYPKMRARHVELRKGYRA